MTSMWKRLWKDSRGFRIGTAAACAGLLFLIGGSYFSRGGSSAEVQDASVRFYTRTMEERIEALCEELSGVREAHVLLTLESGVEYVYADGGAWDRESPLLLQEISPQIRGVAVICTGGDDSAVRLTITELLSAALGIPSSRIRVAGK